MKHAYLIIAHNEFEILKRLIQALDDERNDIYIHFDRKLNHYPDCRTSYAKLTFLEERMDVRWGDISVVDAEFALFDEAYRRGEYSYYHLLSGVDMPLKTQNYIHRFFEKNAGKEFVGYYQGNISKEIDRKVCRWHLFPKSFKETEGGLAVTKRVLRAGCVRLQSLLGIRRNKDINFRKGTQWLSISNELICCSSKKRYEEFIPILFVRTKYLCRLFAGILLFATESTICTMKDTVVCG